MQPNRIDHFNTVNRIREISSLTKAKHLPKAKKIATKIPDFHLKTLAEKEGIRYPYIDIFMQLSSVLLLVICIYLENAITPVPYVLWGISIVGLLLSLSNLPSTIYAMRIRGQYHALAYTNAKKELSIMEKPKKDTAIIIAIPSIAHIKFVKPTFTYKDYYVAIIKTSSGQQYHVLINILEQDFMDFLTLAYEVNYPKS